MTRTQPGHTRKAFVSKGDDATLSRWVKVTTNRTRAFQPLLIGRDVRKGKFKGYWIYTLSLEERATCPESCVHWRDCYGNHMPYAHRISHVDPTALMKRIEQQINELISVRGRAGILIRLHALGDFFSAEYVRFWSTMLAMHGRLAIYGYTARHPLSDIGRQIDRTKQIWGDRFAIRWSDGGAEQDCTISVHSRTERVPGAFVCPEQQNLCNSKGQAVVCATCGLCWSTRKNVAFMDH